MTRYKSIAAALALLLALLLTGCAVTPPQPIGGAPTQSPTDAAPTTTAEPETVPVSGGAQSDSPAAPTAPAATPTAAVQATLPPVGTAGTPTRVEVFYSGAFSMMGFSDAPATTIYENTMEALAACVSLCWPLAQTDYFRYSQAIDKQAMRHSKETLLGHIGLPSFYRDTPMTEQPLRIKTPDAAAQSVAERMNEPIESFYEAVGLSVPTAQGSGSGTPVALSACDPDALTIIVTDLHELRTDDGALIGALNQAGLGADRAIGLVAIMSEFAGYIPDVGANKTTYLWGDPPSGTLDALLDYEYYKLGVSIDPQTRQTRARPFYVLCIGDQQAVGTYVQTLSDRLTREFQDNATFQLRTALYGSSYVADGYTLDGHLEYLSGAGVTAMADANAPAGVSQVELKASQQTRYLEWALTYDVHPSDPRVGAFQANDFDFSAKALADGGTETALSDLSWSITAQTASTVTFRLRLELPQGILTKGSYQLSLTGALVAPQERPGSDWVNTFGWDADGVQLMAVEQNTAAFDGSRTLFLSRLIDALGMANLSRLGGAPLGTVRIALTVYA